MVQLSIGEVEGRHCRSCGRDLRLTRHRVGRYPYLCDSCRTERRRARRMKYQGTYLDRIKEDRLRLLSLLGAKCALCGRPKQRLELHRKMTAESGDTTQQGGASRSRGRGWITTINEAKVHPERFAFLCNSCHKFVTWMENKPDVFSRLRLLVPTSGRA